MAVSIATNIWGIFQHTRLIGRLGVLDWLFATPSSHRVHHGSDAKYLDKNYGEVLLIWDHLFGTFQAEEEEPIYGVTSSIETDNPLRIWAAGFRWLQEKRERARTPWSAAQCLWKPPEWEPEGKPTASTQPIH